MNHYKPFDIITVPFPYTDQLKSKKRPALVISDANEFGTKVGHSVCAMITSHKNKPWPNDTLIKNIKTTGLPAPSVIRMKLFTIDHQIIIDKIGRLSQKDITTFKKSFALTFSALLK